MTFATRLLRWFDTHGRHDLPWQHPRTPYRVWLAEIMLQQTQVATVLPYYARFLARFPDVETLATAPTDDVLAHWAGLGYYARARNLQRAAQAVVAQGAFPDTLDGWQALPGVGRSTAAAVLAQAYEQRHAILDGNVRRVLARHAGVEGWPGLPNVTARLWAEAEARLPKMRLADYTQALMDLGATLCTARAPRCADCPVTADCVALREDRVAALPSPRPARQRPSRRADVLLIEDAAGRWLLERRAPAGIWGGLWCPPVVELLPASIAGVELDTAMLAAREPVHHAFTHFDLALTPRLLRLAHAAPAAVADDATRWLTMDDLAALGLPAPMRRLFAQLQQERTGCLEPCSASSSAVKPKDSTARRTRARSASASTSTSASAPGRNGSPIRRA